MTSIDFLTGVVNEHMNGEVLPNAKTLTICYTHKQDDPVQVEKDIEQFMIDLAFWCTKYNVHMQALEEHQIAKAAKGGFFVRMVLFDCDYIDRIALINAIWKKGPIYVSTLKNAIDAETKEKTKPVKPLFIILGFNFQMDEFYVGKNLTEIEADFENLDLDNDTKSNWLFETRKEAQQVVEQYQKAKKQYVEDNRLLFTIMKI